MNHNISKHLFIFVGHRQLRKYLYTLHRLIPHIAKTMTTELHRPTNVEYCLFFQNSQTEIVNRVC